MNGKKIGTLVVTAVVLAACASELDRARRAKPMGDAFSRALSSGYLHLAENEQSNNNYNNANRLAKRAIRSAKGVHPAPESGTDKQAELNAARMRLIAALSPDAQTATPETAAEAQVAYDCWVLKFPGQDESQTANCKNRFEAAMSQLPGAMKPGASKGMIEHDISMLRYSTQPVLSPGDPEYSQAMPENAKSGMDQLGAPKHKFMVYFDFDSAEITLEAQDVVNDIIEELLANNYKMIRIEGHADRAGTQQYNQSLSVRRAAAVNSALIAALSGSANTTVKGFGERKPAKSTSDGIREVLNRRTEVFLF